MEVTIDLLGTVFIAGFAAGGLFVWTIWAAIWYEWHRDRRSDNEP